MISDSIETDYLSEMDFSFVRYELNNLIDVPREFNEELYLKFDVSRTVLDFWRKIDYKPSYYYLFWLFYKVHYRFRFEEYRSLRDILISGVLKENNKIGKALVLFAANEDETYNQYIHADGRHMYFLSYEYEDGSEDMIAASVDYDEMIDLMNKEAIENKHDSFDVKYVISKYPMKYSNDNDQVVGIDYDRGCGHLIFDSDGVLGYMQNMKDFLYDDMDAMDLLEPYVIIPHPFKKGDIVKYDYYGEKYGVLYYAGDDDMRNEANSQFYPDGSDFITTRITLYKDDKDGKYRSGHDHICPLYYDRVDEDEDLEGDLKFFTPRCK